MNRHFVINKYLSKEFLKTTTVITCIFFGVGLLMSLFEEINFFKNLDAGFNTPLLLAFLFTPSLLYSFFPFVILISGMLFFLKIKKTDELTAINISGKSNFSIIIIPSVLSVLLGIFFITSFNPISSIMIKKYETIKGVYEEDLNYLAAITKNGIWIREKDLTKNTIIRAAAIEGNYLHEVTIYEFDKSNDFTRRIEAESADISFLKWNLKNAKIVRGDGVIVSDNIENISYNSIYDIIKIKTLFSNLDTISFWNINKEIKFLEQRGYSTTDMKTKLQKSLSFPLFLLSMLLLSSVFTLGSNFNKSGLSHVFITIILSVLIFFFNDFSAALGKTEKLPIIAAIWMPICIIFVFSSIGIINANQK